MSAYLTSTKTIRLIRDGEKGEGGKEVKVNMVLNVHRNHKTY